MMRQNAFKALLLVIAMLAVSVPARAQSAAANPVRLVPRTAWLLTQAPTSVAPSEWQRQYDAAEIKRQAGKKKMLIGALVMGGGLAIAVASVAGADNDAKDCINKGQCDDLLDDSGAGSGAMLGTVIYLGGGGVLTWGILQWHDASQKIDQLELQKAGKSATLFEFGRHQSIGVRASAAPSVQYQVAW